MKNYIKIVSSILILIFLFILILSKPSFAARTREFDINDVDFSSIGKEKEKALKDKFQEYENNPDIDILTAYKEVTAIVSNEDLANIVEDNRQLLYDTGIDNSTISTATALLNSIKAETIIDIAENDLEIDEMIEKSKNDENFNLEEELKDKIINDTSFLDIAKTTFKLLFSIVMVKAILVIFLIVSTYSIVITGLIFKKAGKHPWGTLIPLYRDIIHLKICGFTPWVLLLLLIPIFRMACINCNCNYI